MARLKIKDIAVNGRYTLELVVTSAIARKTRAGKDYLQLTFYDGTDSIGGNYWDWAGAKIPEKNTILSVTCQVTEWAGAKQLNISGLKTNTDYVLADFMPTGTSDIEQIYKDAYALACQINNTVLREITVSALDELRVMWLEVPAAKGIHHAYTAGTLVHSYSVAKIAKAIASEIPGANIDLCVAGGLLHDIGKLFTYKLNGLTVDMTNDGMLLDHIFIGANFIGNFADTHVDTDNSDVMRTVRLLQHVILAHHGRLEYGSPVTPMCIEAQIVHAADGVDSAAEQVRAESSAIGDRMWTDKIYTLGNRPVLTPQYVQAVLVEE